jgi:hypothetical protein
MRSKERHKKSHKKLIWAGIIVLILVSSALGYMWQGGGGESGGNVYGGYEFVKTESGWASYINGQYVGFDYLPDELEEIEFDVFPIIKSKAYLAFDASEKDSNVDYSIRKLAGVLTLVGIKPVLSCYEEENCPDIPLVDCDNEFPVIKFKKGDEVKVTKEGSCLIIEGDTIGMSKAVDRLSYSLLGIM